MMLFLEYSLQNLLFRSVLNSSVYLCMPKKSKRQMMTYPHFKNELTL